jgi:hypothetical protein
MVLCSLRKFFKISKIIFSIIILIILFYIFNFFKIFNQLIIFALNKNEITQVIHFDIIHNYSLNECKNQFYENYTQYYVKIDDELYPKYIPKIFDKRINFDCLNKNKKRNRILLWTKFVGSDDFFYGICVLFLF